MLNDSISDSTQRMSKCVTMCKQDFAKLRTGRAHVSLLDHVRADYYGNEVPLSQCANIIAEDARTLSIQPWDKNMVGVIEKAILTSDLGLNPNTAGNTIRIVLPALTEERRKELVKVARAEAENARVAIRNVRRDAKNDIKEMLKDKMISEDDERRAEEQLQKLTDKHVAEVDALLSGKEKEMLAL
ncbi:MAG: ribosome recycling factor [Nevskiales bacterium]